MTILVNASVTVQQPDPGTVDEYGNPIGAWTSVGSFSVWLERVGWNPPDTAGNLKDAADWTVWFNDTGVAFNRGDRVVHDGRTFEFIDPTEPLRRPGGTVHHVIGRLRQATPTLRELVTAGLSMADRCTVTRTNEDHTFNTTTGAYGDPTTTQVYIGPCRVVARAEDDRIVAVADDRRLFRSPLVLLPFDVTDVEIDDVVQVTASEDTRLVGRSLRVTGVEVATDTTARVLYCEDEQETT